MATATTLPLRKRTTRTCRLAEFFAFVFVGAEKRFEKLTARKNEIISSIHHKVSLFWVIGCFLAILAALCIGYFQAYSAQSAIAGFLDPTAEGLIPKQVLLSVGIGISILGMLIGHALHESIETDEHTDRKIYKPSFWLFLFLSFFYLGFQFVLAKTAGDSVNDGGTNYLPYVVAGLGVFELIIGAVVLEKAMAYIGLFFLNILLGFSLRKMNRTSRKTNNTYRDYLTLLEVHNAQDGQNPLQREGNNNIRRAIAYYSGIKLAKNEEAKEPTPIQDITPVFETPKPVPALNNGKEQTVLPAKTVEPQEAEKHVEQFINDNVDDDLTA